MQFYAHGKLMLTGEYLVLRGANVLAVPTKFGQSLVVDQHDHEEYHWRAYNVQKEVWLKVDFDANWNILDSNDGDKAIVLQRILRQAQKLKGSPLPFSAVSTHLEFDRNWGLGTSSSVIVLVAEWFQVNAFDLFKNSLTGSGYDVATAQASKAVLYNMFPQMHFTEKQLPEVFADTYFVYLGQKQNSEKEVIGFKNKEVSPSQIKAVNNITSQLLQVQNTSEVEELIHQHEKLVSSILDRKTIKEKLFADYPGAIKSLGAWGGDFIWVTHKPLKNYFRDKGYTTIFDWNEIIL